MNDPSMHTSTSKDKISIRQELLRVVACRADSYKNFSSVEAAVTEIINLRHLEWFQLASDVPNQRA